MNLITTSVCLLLVLATFSANAEDTGVDTRPTKFRSSRYSEIFLNCRNLAIRTKYLINRRVCESEEMCDVILRNQYDGGPIVGRYSVKVKGYCTPETWSVSTCPPPPKDGAYCRMSRSVTRAQIKELTDTSAGPLTTPAKASGSLK